MNALTTDLPRSPDSVGVARQLLHPHAIGLGSRQSADAALMVSELVTNALVHGAGSITLRIDLEADVLRVEVADQGDVALEPRPTAGAHGGWGLRIVERLADDWGVRDGSTRVWFQLGQHPVEH